MNTTLLIIYFNLERDEKLSANSKILSKIFLAIGFFIALGNTAQAQQQNFDPAEWIKVCNANPTEPEKRHCIVSRDVRNPQGLLVGQIALGHSADTEPKQLSILVPVPILISPGIAVRIDDGEVEIGKITICALNGCFAELEMKNDLVGRMKAGNNLRVFFKTPPPRVSELSYTVSLKGFTAAFDGEGFNAEDQVAQQKQLDERMLEIAEKKRKEHLEKLRKEQEQQ